MRSVESRIGIAVSPDKVIRAFTDPGMLAGWWGVERTLIELKAGGIYTLAWGISGEGIKYVSSGIVKEYDASRLLHVEKYIYLNPERSFLGPLELSVLAEPSGSGSRLILSQGPYPENRGDDWDWFYDVVNGAWPVVLEKLKTFLEEKFAQ
jgi:uncharacterized protein YndB with AHSA1/START domain